MCRKQPIPTNLDEIFGDNYLAQDIYIFFLLRARNSDPATEITYGGSLHFIKKGQGVFGDNELAKRFRCDRKTVRKTLEKLENVYNKVDIKRTTKGSVYTIVSYDEVTNMDNKRDNKGTSKGQQRDNTVDTNKSDKNIKNDKNDKKNNNIDNTTNVVLQTESVESYGDPDVNSVIEIVKKGIGRGSLSGTVKGNRYAAKRLINKLKKEQRVSSGFIDWKQYLSMLVSVNKEDTYMKWHLHSIKKIEDKFTTLAMNADEKINKMKEEKEDEAIFTPLFSDV